MCLIHPCFQLELCFLTKQRSRRRFGKISIGLHWLQICTVTPANRSASLTVTLFTPFFSRFTTIHAIHLISTRLPIRPSDQPLNQPTRQKYLAFFNIPRHHCQSPLQPGSPLHQSTPCKHVR